MNDKKKLVVFGALLVVVLAVGVFQFTSSPAPAPAPSKKPNKVATNDPVQADPALPADPEAGQPAGTEPPLPANGFAAKPLTARDPFDGGKLSRPLTVGVKPPTSVSPVRPAAAPSMPTGLSGSLPSAAGGNVPVTIAPGEKLPSADDFTYTLAGVIVGEESAAVFADSSGNQRLISVGGSLEPDSQLVSVKPGKVVVRHHGKTITLTLGETSK